MRKQALKKGFTLIELLVVISIITLLASIVIASLTSARKKASVATFIQEVKQFQAGMELYRTGNSTYYVSPYTTTVPHYDPYVRSAENAPFTAFKNAVSQQISVAELEIITSTANTFHYIDGQNAEFYAGFSYEFCGGVRAPRNGYLVFFVSPLELPLLRWGGDSNYYCFTNI